MTKSNSERMPRIHYTFPRGSKIGFEVWRKKQTHSVMDIAYFLNDTNFSNQLVIANYLERMNQDPFFLVASTGLGKTVSVPPHVFLRQCEKYFADKPDGYEAEDLPRVWVVEPTIPIAESQAEFMNSLYAEFLKKNERSKARKFDNYKAQDHFGKALFGCISSNGRVNHDAPIMFVTTGIIALLAKKHELRADLDRVIIDEAHTTIEKSPDVEIAIGICRHLGVTVDYMSATVDTNGLAEKLNGIDIINADEKRFPIWMHNLELPMVECIEHLVRDTLVKANTNSEYYPNSGYRHQRDVLSGVIGGSRSHGMLVVVNSFEGESSDINRFAKLLENADFNSEGQVAILKFASAINRDERKKQAFLRELEAIEARRQNYVIISTSVIEMGVTFPTLDYVVTMDTGFDNVTIGDRTVPKPVPLGVNALKQRIGRVGRKRPGIGYITKEIGAEYTELSDSQLNITLDYEPIQFPLATAPLTSLVYYIAKFHSDLPVSQLWYQLREINFVLPSGVLDINYPDTVNRSSDFETEKRSLEVLGIIKKTPYPEYNSYHLELTQTGKMCEKWVSMNDIYSAVQLQQCATDFCSKNPGDNTCLFWLLMTAFAHEGIDDLRFMNADLTKERFTSRLNARNEIVSLVTLLAKLCSAYGIFAKGRLLSAVQDLLYDEFRSDCQKMGLDPRKCLTAIKSVAAVFETFVDINKNKIYFEAADWLELRWDTFSVENDAISKLYEDPSRVCVSLVETESFGQKAYCWFDPDNAEHTGIVEPKNIAVTLDVNAQYLVKIVGSVDREDNTKIVWKPIHWARVS